MKITVSFVFLSGLLSGIFIAQGLFVLAGRAGWDFGGEFLVIPLIVALIAMGIMIGRTYSEMHRNKYRYRGRNLK